MQVEKNSLHFQGSVAADENVYELNLKLLREIQPEKTKYQVSVQTGVGFSPPRSVNLPFCHLGLLKGRFSSL